MPLNQNSITNFAASLLRGIGQIMLQENAATGLLFLIGIFYGSLYMGLAAVIAASCGTTVAYFFKKTHDNVQSGLYGFSAALVGVALILFFEPVLFTWVSIIIGAVLASLLQHFFIVRKIPAFTFPFVVVTWVLMYLMTHVLHIAPSKLLSQVPSLSQDFMFAFRGYGQVIFQSATLAGVLFFIGVFIHTPLAAIYGLVAAIIAGATSSWFGISNIDVNMGLYSYNAILCALVFAGDKLEDGIWVFISILISIFISWAMWYFKLTALTFPFVAATWITLLIKKVLK